MNQAAWDDAHRHLAVKRRSNPNWGDEYRNGGHSCDATELELLEDVSGVEALQLSCAGDASQAFSLANLGAKVTACDFSPVAIEEARRNAQKLGIDVTFVVEDSQRLAGIKECQFDVVWADYNLWYYEDLSTACENWFRVLRRKGRLILHEGHPITTWCVEEESETRELRAVRSYTDRTPEYYPFHIQDFVTELEAVEFPHTVSDILNAIVKADFIIERMVERTQEDREDSAIGKLPHDFFITARKPG